jgi:hypothetical protein
VSELVEQYENEKNIRLIETLANSEEGRNAIIENFDELLSVCPSTDISKFIRTMLRFKMGQKMIEDSLGQCIKKCDISEIDKIILGFSVESRNDIITNDYNVFLDKAKEDSKLHYAIFKQFEGQDLRQLYIALSQYNEVYSKIKKRVDEGKEEKLFEGINLLFEHMNGGKAFDENNVQIIGAGASGVVFKVDKYIIKLAHDKEKYEVPYDPEIAQPLLRDCVRNEKGEPIVMIEVFNELDIENVMDKDAIKLKYSLLSRGIEWKDVLSKNVGRLKEGDDNRRIIPPGDVHAGIKERENYDPKEIPSPKPGDAVVLDVDCLYDMFR